MPILSFDPLTLEETRNLYPSYYRRDITCFSIIKDGGCVGLYGIIDRGIDPNTGGRLGEGFLTVFPDFRFQILNKTFLQSLFDHALATGFQRVYTWTRLSSWQRVLKRFESCGIHRLETPPPWDLDPPKLVPPNLDSPDSAPRKVWFVKEQKPEKPKEKITKNRKAS